MPRAKRKAGTLADLREQVSKKTGFKEGIYQDRTAGWPYKVYRVVFGALPRPQFWIHQVDPSNHERKLSTTKLLKSDFFRKLSELHY